MVEPPIDLSIAFANCCACDVRECVCQPEGVSEEVAFA